MTIPSSDIVLATINAKYIHAAFGLRYLRENLGSLREQTTILEFTNQFAARDMAERILSRKPKIIGLGVYIWNVTQTTALIGVLKQVAPDVIVVIGGPEVSYEIDQQPICTMADHVVIGEGEDAFRNLCEAYLNGAEHPPALPKIVAGGLPNLSELVLPYDGYSDEDLAHRVLYVEASRGCPFRCEFCLSSLDQRVRPFPLEPFFAAMDRLFERGALHFKFVDRTFNLQVAVSVQILQFFLDRMRPGLLVHFEMIPDRLPDELRILLCQFPPGTLQLEIGIQSLDPEVGVRISRRQHQGRMAENFAFLNAETHAHVHADLIIGLPGEDAVGFATGFNRLHSMGPEEIQVGVLKRLRGTPIIRHTDTFGLRFHPDPPYEILQT
ncbi:MAG: B12-binding domain-containing radical SAM protein, partial [Rhodobacterales bacterium]|nr:B12-binding domain-containing radical SAM protein [Rhodobacterales bacterium]